MTEKTMRIDNGEIDVRVNLAFFPAGTRAHAIAFDRDGRTIAETHSSMYVGYCHSCIARKEIMAMGLFDALAEEMDNAGHFCVCD